MVSPSKTKVRDDMAIFFPLHYVTFSFRVNMRIITSSIIHLHINLFIYLATSLSSICLSLDLPANIYPSVYFSFYIPIRATRQNNVILSMNGNRLSAECVVAASKRVCRKIRPIFLLNMAQRILRGITYRRE